MKNHEEIISSLRHQFSGYGHWKISIEVDGETLKTVTTNSLAIDAAFDDCYDDEVTDGSYYESRKEAQDALINEILNYVEC